VKKKAYKASKAEFMMLIEKWKPRLWLDEWTLHIDHERDVRKENHGLAALTCEPRWQYMEATISVVHEAWWACEPEIREREVVHELLHCLLSPIGRIGTKQEELTVCRLSRAFMHAEKWGDE